MKKWNEDAIRAGMSPGQRRDHEEREKVQASVRRDNAVLWIKAEDAEDEANPPDSPETLARKKARSRLAMLSQNGLDLESQSSLIEPEKGIGENGRSTARGPDFDVAFATIRTLDESAANSSTSRLKRHVAKKICASLVDEVIDRAVAEVRSKRSIGRILPNVVTETSQKLFAFHGLRETHSWPDRTRYEERTLFLFPLSSRVRLAAIKVSEAQSWQLLFSVVVLASCVLITLEDPFEDDFYPYATLYNTPSATTVILNALNTIITLAFLVEFGVNVLAQGLFLGSRTYMMDAWNNIDLLVVITGVVELASSGGPNLKGLRSIKVGRILLYTIRRIPDVRILVELLGRLAAPLSAAVILNFGFVALAALFFQQLFASAGGARCHGIESGLPFDPGRACTPEQNLAMGYNKCATPFGNNRSTCVGCERQYSCVLEATVVTPVTRRTYSFDDYQSALVATIQLLTLSGWGRIMQDTMDADNPAQSVVVMAFILVGSLFLMKSFLAVFINKLDVLKDRSAEDKQRSILGHWKNARGTSKAFRTWRHNAQVSKTAKTERCIARFRACPNGEMTCLRAAARMRNETLALAFERWYHVNLLTIVLNKSNADMLMERDEHLKASYLSLFSRVRNRCKVLSASKAMEVSMIAAILFSIFLMLTEHAYASFFGRLWADVGAYMQFHALLAIGQIICALLFAIELVIKLLGQGLRTFVRRALNWIDLIVAVSSIIDIHNLVQVHHCYSSESVNPFACEGASLAIQLLRGLRLARLAKLVRFFPNLLQQLRLLWTMLSSCSAVFIFLGIFVFTFSVLGMVFFGGQLHVPVTDRFMLRPGMLVYFRWSENPASYIQSNLLRQSLPGHPARIVYIDYSISPAAPYLVSPIYGKALAEILAQEDYRGKLLRLDVATLRGRALGGGTTGASALAEAITVCDATGGNDDATGGKKVCQWVVWTAIGEQPTAPTILSISIRSNFNSFFQACMTVLQLLTKAQWPELMAVARSRFGSIVLVYFYLLIFIGEIIILNMTSAVVIVCFRSKDELSADAATKHVRTARQGLDPLLARDHLIEQIRGQTRQMLIAGTGDANWRVRSDYVKALTAVGDPGDETIIDTLQLKVADAHTAVRVNAVSALAVVCPAAFAQSFPDVVVAVRKALRDESRFVREKASNALASISIGDPGTIRDLIRATSDPEPMVRIAAISSLGLVAQVNDAHVIRAIMARIHMAEDETAEVLQSVHTALTILQDNSGLQQSEAKKNLKEELARDERKGSKEADAEYLKNSALLKQEREEQADLVKMIRDAEKIGMFNKGYKIKSTTDQRKTRYAIAAKQVERVCEKIQIEAKRLRDQGNKTAMVDKRSPLYYSMEATRLEIKREQLLGHLRLLKAPDSLFCIPPLHPIRVRLRKILADPSFEALINTCIFISSVTLALERPGIGPAERVFLDIVNSALNGIFLLECLLKIVVMSFWSYLADGWNRLDLSIVFIAYLDEIVTRTGADVGTGALKVLRISRLLRPLRSIRNLEALTVLSNALLNAAYPLLVTTCIILMSITVLAALKMQLMIGTMGYCTDPHVEHRELCNGTRSDGVPRRWTPATFTYDWIGAGMLSTLIFSLVEGSWIRLVYDTVDATGLHTGPYEWAHPGVGIIGVFAVIVIGFLLMKIYTAIFVKFYAEALLEKEKEHSKGTELSRHALSTKIRRHQLPKLMDGADLQNKQKMKEMLEHPTTEALVTLCVVINLALMGKFVLKCFLAGVESYKRTQLQTDLSKISEYFFAGIFAIEVTLKIWCMTISIYRYKFFAMLEWGIVMLCFLTVPLTEMVSVEIPVDPRNLRFLRLIRVLRLLRAAKVFRFMKNVEELADSLGRASTSLLHMVLLLMVFYFCFGVMGVAFFGMMCKEGDQAIMMRCRITSSHSRLPASQSFQHIGSAFVGLFRISSGDAWSDLITKLGMTSRTSNMMHREPGYIENAKKWLAAFSAAETKVDIDLALRELQLALPGCVSEEELKALEDGVNIDCSKPNHCDSTCGGLTAYFFLPFFVILTNNVVMKLVVPPLMIEIGRQLAIGNSLPGTDRLMLHKFSVVVTRWKRQAYAKRLVLWVEEQRLEKQRHAGVRRSSSKMGRTNSASDIGRTSSGETLGRTTSGEASQAPEKMMPDTGTKYEGIVSKRGQNNTSYQQRYFVLAGDGMLYYYKDKKAYSKGDKPNGCLECSGLVACKPKAETSGRYGFIITDKEGKNVVCSVGSSKEREMWLQKLTTAAKEVFFTKSEVLALRQAALNAPALGTCHEGILFKRGQINTRFQERYFVLSGGVLKYYKTKKDWDAKGTEQGLLQCKGLKVEEKAHEELSGTEGFDFSLTDANGKEVVCKAESLEEGEMWIAKLRAAVSEATTTGADSLSHEGIVRKRGQLNSAFQDRYFVLSGGILAYYKTKQHFVSNKPVQGSMQCLGLQVLCSSPKGNKAESFQFTIVDLHGKEMICEVGSAAEREIWIEKLMETARVAAEATPSIRYQGVVNKRGQLNTSLQARYFVVLEVTSPQGDVLTDVVVQYFNSKEAFDSNQEPKGSLSCKGMRVKASLKLDGVEGFFFTVIDVNDKEVCCCVPTPHERAEWVEVLEDATKAASDPLNHPPGTFHLRNHRKHQNQHEHHDSQRHHSGHLYQGRHHAHAEFGQDPSLDPSVARRVCISGARYEDDSPHKVVNGEYERSQSLKRNGLALYDKISGSANNVNVALWCDRDGRWKVGRKENDGSWAAIWGFARTSVGAWAVSPNLATGGWELYQPSSKTYVQQDAVVVESVAVRQERNFEKVVDPREEERKRRLANLERGRQMEEARKRGEDVFHDGTGVHAGARMTRGAEGRGHLFYSAETNGGGRERKRERRSVGAEGEEGVHTSNDGERVLKRGGENQGWGQRERDSRVLTRHQHKNMHAQQRHSKQYDSQGLPREEWRAGESGWESSLSSLSRMSDTRDFERRMPRSKEQWGSNSSGMQAQSAVGRPLQAPNQDRLFVSAARQSSVQRESNRPRRRASQQDDRNHDVLEYNIAL